MIRVRRLPATGLLRRRRYEVEVPATGAIGSPAREVTSTPVTLIDKQIGIGEAWALVHAADDAWNGRVGEWVTLVEDDG